MKKRISLRFILILCLTLLFVTSVAILAGCNQDEDPNEFVEGQGNTVQVVLDSLQDKLIAGSVDKVSNGYIDYRLKSGSPVPQPGVTKNTSAPVLEGYVFDGYYEGEVNEDGSITYGEKWDFSRKVTESMTLYGKWLVQYKIRVNFVLDGKLVGKYEESGVSGNAETVTSIKDPIWTDENKNYTYVQMFADEACTEPLVVSREQPFAHGCTQDNTVCNVYAQFIEGRWTLVRTASNLKTINAGSNLYLMNDIDMSELNTLDGGRTDITVANIFSGIIEGNGHTISNLHYFRQGKKTGTMDYTAYCFGLFAQISDATIRNVTFENCSVGGVVQMRNNISEEYFYGFIAGYAEGNCTFEGINFVNCELKPLQFNIALLSDAENEAERAKLEQNNFIGQGSDYQDYTWL